MAIPLSVGKGTKLLLNGKEVGTVDSVRFQERSGNLQAAADLRVPFVPDWTAPLTPLEPLQPLPSLQPLPQIPAMPAAITTLPDEAQVAAMVADVVGKQMALLVACLAEDGTEEQLLLGVLKGDRLSIQAYADRLEERGLTQRAERVRALAGGKKKKKKADKAG